MWELLHRPSVGEWSVVGLGAGLLAASPSYLTVGDGSLWRAFAGPGVPIGLSLVLVAFGVWLRASDRSAALASAASREATPPIRRGRSSASPSSGGARFEFRE